MPKYVVTVEQKIDMEAKDEKTVRELLKQDAPFLSYGGCGEMGLYSAKTRERVRIVSIKEK